MNKKMLNACCVIRSNGFTPVLLCTDEGKISIVLFKSNVQNIVYGIQIEPETKKTKLKEPEWIHMGHLYKNNSVNADSIGLGLYMRTKEFTDESLKELFVESQNQYDYDIDFKTNVTDSDEAVKRYINKNNYNVVPYEDFITMEY